MFFCFTRSGIINLPTRFLGRNWWPYKADQICVTLAKNDSFQSSQNFGGSNFFLTPNLLGPTINQTKFFLDMTFFGPTKFWTLIFFQNIFWPIILLDQNFLWIQASLGPKNLFQPSFLGTPNFVLDQLLQPDTIIKTQP